MPVTLTIDLEDPTGVYAPDGRYVVMARRILDMCAAMGNRKATFFVVGRVAEAAPQLIRDIAAKGHEIAYHSHNHVALTKEDPARFESESRIDKDRLEHLAGKPVIGFRAPRFSLTPKTMEYLDVLSGLGFRYSSSIMPTDVSLFGFPDASRVPFSWPNGMVEFPLPVAQLGKYSVPYLGGIYLYTMPMCLVRAFVNHALDKEVLWTYAHPYDFDRKSNLMRMPGTPLWVSLILWAARRNAEKKIRRVLLTGAAPPLAERLP